MKIVLRMFALLALPLFFLACDKKKDEPTPAVIVTASIEAEKKTSPDKPVGVPLKIAYSDWPGWVAWEIAIQKKWFDEEGVPVEFSWFEYVPSMEAYSAGKVDAVTMTNGDQLVTGSSGAPSVAIVINDYSNGNDMVVAKPGIEKIENLKGKKIGVELGLVSHLLLLKALESGGLSEKDVTLVNVPTDQTPQALKSGSVDAIVAWQPNSGQALKELAGSTPIFTSKNVPGLIYDVLAVNPKSLSERKGDWTKVVKVWKRVVDFIKDGKNIDEAAKIMSARVGLSADEYKPLLGGTFLLTLAEASKAFEKGDTLASIYNSSKVVNEFQVKKEVYKESQAYETYLDPSLTKAVLEAK